MKRILIATLFLSSAALANGYGFGQGYVQDYGSGNTYNTVKDQQGNTYQNGYNNNTGSTWNSRTDTQGNTRGQDSQGNYYQYNSGTNNYNNSNGTNCYGTGLYRVCN